MGPALPGHGDRARTEVLPNASHGFEHGVSLTRQAGISIVAIMLVLHRDQFVGQQAVQLIWFEIIDILRIANQ